jgi:hypothetical protein
VAGRYYGGVGCRRAPGTGGHPPSLPTLLKRTNSPDEPENLRKPAISRVMLDPPCTRHARDMHKTCPSQVPAPRRFWLVVSCPLIVVWPDGRPPGWLRHGCQKTGSWPQTGCCRWAHPALTGGRGSSRFPAQELNAFVPELTLGGFYCGPVLRREPVRAGTANRVLTLWPIRF